MHFQTAYYSWGSHFAGCRFRNTLQVFLYIYVVDHNDAKPVWKRRPQMPRFSLRRSYYISGATNFIRLPMTL